MDKVIKGQAWVFGDNVSTDEILPAHYMTIVDKEELAKHAMEGIRPELAKTVKGNDIFIANDNFGCGSSREHAQLALKGLGIGAVVAKSFARIFFRNAINIGLLVIECPEAVDDVEEGDMLQIDLDKGYIENITKGKEYPIKKLPDFLLEYLKAGGLIEYLISEKDKEELG